MIKNSPLRWCILGLFPLVLATAVYATDYTIVLPELLNRPATQELVSFPFAAATGECLADSVRLTGANGAVPVQLASVERWPGTEFVKSARLSFVVETLAPLATNSYTASYGSKASPSPAPATDLKVTPTAPQVELTTSQLGLRLLLGEKKYATPEAVTQVPGPLLGLRLGTGEWTGGSALTGTAAVRSWSAVLTDAGPVFARVLTTYTFDDENVVTLAATLVAGDNTVRWEMSSREDRPAGGIDLRQPPIPGVKQAIFPKGYGQWAKADRTVALTPGPEPFTFLSPNSTSSSLFPDCPSTIRLAAAPGGPELYLCSREPGVWSTPVPMSYGGFKTWNLDIIQDMWAVWKRHRLPVVYAPDGTVTLQANFTRGARSWWTAGGVPRCGDQLDRIKDMQLAWPADPKRPHPRLFVDQAEIAATWTRALAEPELMKVLTTGGGQWAAPALPVLMKPAAERKKTDLEAAIKPLRDNLALYGNFDVMRHAVGVATLYDVLIDSDLLTPQEKALYRAQFAYLAYLMADPQCWSMERGYITGNPNMSCSYTLSLGVLACAIPDHPMAKTWTDRATQWMDKWLTDEVGPNGEWISEGSGYGYVSLDPMLSYAAAAQRAGVHDFSQDPRLQKLVLFFAKCLTPHDPDRKNLRVTPAYGRGDMGNTTSSFGLAARLFAKSNPALAQTFQWVWKETGNTPYIGDARLGGVDPCYMDRRLPMAAPDWGSEWFPNLGAILRAGFNTPNESCVNVLAGVQSRHNLDIWTPGIGALSKWFGCGQPLSTNFTFEHGYKERHELLRNGVRLARNWGGPNDAKTPFGHYTETTFGAFAALSPVDYVRASFVNTTVDDRDWFPVELPAFPKVTPATGTSLNWTRQLLFVKDPEPAGAAWLLLRDTTLGGQPTAWQFWTLSEKLGASAQAAEPAAFLADQPGAKSLPARELPPGERYTALGQHGVDVEYLVASPANTPRHTLRYGSALPWPWKDVKEYQDLLHLQLPGDGVYYVAAFPHPRKEAVPALVSLDSGKLVKVSGAFGTDYAFLASAAGAAEAEGVRLNGTAAAVQLREGLTVLTLGAPGEVHYKDFALAIPAGSASLRITPTELTVALPAAAAGGQLTVTAPDGWAVAHATPGVTLNKTEKTGYVLTFPAGTTAVRLVKK